MKDKAKLLAAFREGGKYKDTAEAKPKGKGKGKPASDKKPGYVVKK